MALNLKRAGAELSVYARRAQALAPLTEAGAIACASPAEVGRQADIIFTMVSDTADVEEVILGAQGVSEGARSGSVVVDMSTISPAVTRSIAARLAEQGVEMLDAPVSGGEQGAIDGTLSIMVGGAESVFERVRPWFARMGRSIVHVGASGAGQVCKACNQVVIGHTLVGVGEALLLARAAGVDPLRVREALLGGFAQSRVLEVHGQRMIEGEYAPGFKARLHQKDMRIILETAAQLGIALPGAAVFAQSINALVGRGSGELDSSAIHQIQLDLCGRGGP